MTSILHAPALGAIALAALLTARPARAQVVDISWDSGGRMERAMTVAAGKFAEVCGKLRKGQAVAWTFKAGAAMDFNIHYHQGKEVIFPAEMKGATESGGTLPVNLDQDYCWMWTNKSAQPASLQFTLKR